MTRHFPRFCTEGDTLSRAEQKRAAVLDARESVAGQWHCTDGSYGFRAVDPVGNVYAIENGRQTLQQRADAPISEADRLRNAAAVILAQDRATEEERHAAYAMQVEARRLESSAAAE